VQEPAQQPVVQPPVETVKAPEVQQPVTTGTVKRINTKQATRSEGVVRQQTIGTRTTARQGPPQRVPTLNEYVEDEDTSLRLAELFDDIETSD
jgi:hypothetical protein